MIQDALSQYDYALAQFRHVPGFVGLGIGVRETSGGLTSDRAWRVYVQQKYPNNSLSNRERVPARLCDIPTDVIEYSNTRCNSYLHGEPATGVNRQKQQSAVSGLVEGSAIANDKGVPGSIGCFARLRSSEQLVLLSNYHILFAKNCRKGDRIWSLPDDSRLAAKPIAQVLFGKAGIYSDCGEQTFVDAAIGVLDEAVLEKLSEHTTRRSDSGWAEAEVGGSVSKTGAATGHTQGIVVDICYPDRWYWEYRSENAPRQILIRPSSNASVFSQIGDSGAVVRGLCDNAVALLWGSNARGEGVASPMRAVVRALGLCFDSVPYLEVP